MAFWSIFNLKMHKALIVLLLSAKTEAFYKPNRTRHHHTTKSHIHVYGRHQERRAWTEIRDIRYWYGIQFTGKTRDTNVRTGETVTQIHVRHWIVPHWKTELKSLGRYSKYVKKHHFQKIRVKTHLFVLMTNERQHNRRCCGGDLGPSRVSAPTPTIGITGKILVIVIE